LSIARLWLMPLPSSLWVDEMVTAFIVQHGPAEPSLAVAPQVTKSIYFALPRSAVALFGSSEIVYRLPSLILMGIALFFIASLARRLIHPQAGWFAIFACLGMRGISYEAANARPYALGICVVAGSLFFLARWLDSGRWFDAVLFLVLAALLWRIQLVYWPVYFVFALYAVVRLLDRDTDVSWWQAGIIFILMAVTQIPVLLDALPLYRGAKAHVIVAMPSPRDLMDSLKLGLLLTCGVGAWLLGRLIRLPRDAWKPSRASVALVLGWWLCAPLGLVAMSWLTGNSVFVSRYLSESLPGAALTGTLVAALFIPSGYWKPSAAALGIGVLLLLGRWSVVWPPHQDSDWRGAATALNQLSLGNDTPVICPSPFIEAQSPVWRPDYPLPGFLYCHLAFYPVQGRLYLFPFDRVADGKPYAAELSEKTLATAPRFLIYGPRGGARFWRDWFLQRPEFADWRQSSVGNFGDVDVILFER